MIQQQQNSEQASEATSALHRKVRVGKADHQARAMSLPKALRLSLAKVADELCDMAMAVIGIRAQTCKADELTSHLQGTTLLMLMDGPQRRRGAAMFDPIFVGGLIQQQTMGKVMPTPEEQGRLLTATDAAMCAPFLDDLIARTATLPEEKEQRCLIEGFRFGAHCVDERLLLMALEEPEYEVFQLTVDMAGGVRQGQITLCFPVADAAPLAASGGAMDRRGDAQQPKTSRLERTVLALHVDLNVALARIRMPLSDLQSLKVGVVLDLDVSTFDQAIVQTCDGRKLSRGTLGQIDGTRALQLEQAPEPFNAPRRRASDRADLDLPRVSGDGTGTRSVDIDTGQKQLPVPPMAPESAFEELPAMAAMPTIADMPAMDQMPDMSDLPGLNSEGDPPEYGIN